VTRSPRRLYLYWLLLLVPTLAVGVGAVALLWREQARLERDARSARETRRASVVGRTRLVAENMDLLASDVRDNLASAVRELPTAETRAFLASWPVENPLVRAGFMLSPFGNLTVPEPGSTEARTFQQRFEVLLAQFRSVTGMPAGQNNLSQANSLSAASGNAGQYQQQRRNLQNLAQGGTLAQKELAIERGGWTTFGGGAEPLAVLVWLQRTGGDDVRGAELNVDALAARLAAALPDEIEPGEGYALSDAAGHTLGARGDIPAGAEPIMRLPLDAVLLPGWQIAGFLTAPATDRAGQSLFAMGSLLTAIFVTTIVVGGSLLLRQAEASASEARQKTSFVANASHEFKTPLTTIRLYAELLEQGRVRDDAQRAGYLRTIGGETQRLARLVNNVLDFSKLEQGKKQYQRVPLDLRAELAALLDAHAPRVTEAGMHLACELPAGPLLITTDRDAVAQIVLNLVENACKYAAAGGEVTVTLTARAARATSSGQGGAEVRVSDRGPGVPAAHAEKIFEQFHRVDATLTAEQTGAGLGLSIARQLARGLGGDLRHEPREGGGTVFIFELP
jgi:signal transduction histidine kinase